MDATAKLRLLSVNVCPRTRRAMPGHPKNPSTSVSSTGLGKPCGTTADSAIAKIRNGKPKKTSIVREISASTNPGK